MGPFSDEQRNNNKYVQPNEEDDYDEDDDDDALNTFTSQREHSHQNCGLSGGQRPASINHNTPLSAHGIAGNNHTSSHQKNMAKYDTAYKNAERFGQLSSPKRAPPTRTMNANMNSSDLPERRFSESRPSHEY